MLLQNINNANSLAHIAQKLRVMIASSAITINSLKVSVTVSIGATLIHEKDTLESLIERADGLMYMEKLKILRQLY